jgi:hypothetical protein
VFNKYLAKILRIKPIEQEDFKKSVPFSEHQPFSFFPKSLTVAEKAMLNHIVQLDKTIKTMKKFDTKSLIIEQKKLKWKYAANCINTFFFYVAILYALVIYTTFFIECSNTANKPPPTNN